MKRAIRIVVIACALTIGTGASTAAHELYVTTPGGDVLEAQPIARNLTPRIFDREGNYVGDGGTFSAASQGTNVACQAVGTDGPAIIYGGPYCKKPSN